MLMPFDIFATKKPCSSISKATKLWDESPENRHAVVSGGELDYVRHRGLLETSYIGLHSLCLRISKTKDII
jgi:hypothetical protein